jgi:tRNA (guanine37-N1)-methyltransferase
VQIDVLTIFPGMFTGFLGESMIKRAQERGLVRIALHDFRRYAADKHSTVDDYPFGGGPGMVLKPEPIFRAVEEAHNTKPRAAVILLTPQGKRYHHRLARVLAGEERLILICGRYKGLDDRVRTLADHEISIGDYVLTGGELPAMVVIDSVVRLIPGVLGDEESAEGDSFYEGILDAPQFTRPRDFRGQQVPEVLISGNHEQIRLWRRREALRRTLLRRPDLLEDLVLTKEDVRILESLREEENL